MNGKQSWRTWRIALIWLAFLLGSYGFGIQVGRLFAFPVAPPPACQTTCNCANVNYWSPNPSYTQVFGDFIGTPPSLTTTAIVNCNVPAPTACFGGGTTIVGPCSQYQVTNTVKGCSPLTLPGALQCTPGAGGATFFAGPFASNNFSCNP